MAEKGATGQAKSKAGPGRREGRGGDRRGNRGGPDRGADPGSGPAEGTRAGRDPAEGGDLGLPGADKAARTPEDERGSGGDARTPPGRSPASQAPARSSRRRHAPYEAGHVSALASLAPDG
jgi:hypothetical protein